MQQCFRRLHVKQLPTKKSALNEEGIQSKLIFAWILNHTDTDRNEAVSDLARRGSSRFFVLPQVMNAIVTKKYEDTVEI